MSDKASYRIPFIGLNTGIHHYGFEADETFFSRFSESLVVKAKVNFEVELEKLSTMINLDISLMGEVETNCDRCGSELTSEINGEFRVIVKFGEETSDVIDDIIILGPSEQFINLDQLFYEFTHLCLPQKNVHEFEGDCNQKALEALRKFELKESEEIDPRWAQLKKLK